MYKLPKDLVSGVLNYLGKRPFIEVAPLINAIGDAVAKQHIEEEKAKEIKKEVTAAIEEDKAKEVAKPKIANINKR